MNKVLIEGRSRLPMRLQFFAEPGSGGSGGDGGTGGEGGSGSPGGEMSFDDFLGTGDNQAEFDRRVNDAVTSAVSAAQEKWRIMTDDKLSEAERLSKMNKEEKAQYMQRKKEKELSAREADITRRELMAEAKNTLASDGLPSDLAEVLNYSDADACKQSMETVKKAFQTAVEAAVNERLKGDKPPRKDPSGGGDEMAKMVEDIMYNI